MSNGERQTLRMPSPEGVGAGQQALVKMPIGNYFHAVYLVYSSLTLAQMTEIRILLNGKIVHRYSAVDRDKMNQFIGLAAANGTLVIPFDRKELKNRVAEEDTGINTGSRGENGKLISSFEIQIDIAGTASGTPRIDVFAEVSTQRAGGIGTILHCVPYTRSAAGAGELQVSDIPYGDATRQLLNRVWIKTEHLTRLKLERDTYTTFERSKALNELIQSNGVRKPQTGFFVYDTTELGYGGASLIVAGAQDFRLIMEMAQAEQITIWPEYLGVLGD